MTAHRELDVVFQLKSFQTKSNFTQSFSHLLRIGNLKKKVNISKVLNRKSEQYSIWYNSLTSLRLDTMKLFLECESMCRSNLDRATAWFQCENESSAFSFLFWPDLPPPSHITHVHMTRSEMLYNS